MFGGHDHVEHRELRAHLASESSRRQADSAPQKADIGGAERLTEHLNCARRRVEVHRSDAQKSGLARAVGPKHQPVLMGVDRPIDVVEQRPLVVDDPDTVEG